MEELREVMISMGEGPLQEKEFNSFIMVNKNKPGLSKLFTRWGISPKPLI